MGVGGTLGPVHYVYLHIAYQSSPEEEKCVRQGEEIHDARNNIIQCNEYIICICTLNLLMTHTQLGVGIDIHMTNCWCREVI